VKHNFLLTKYICLCLYTHISSELKARKKPHPHSFHSFSKLQPSMATQVQSAVSVLLVLNLVLYFIITVIASWAVNHALEKSFESASTLTLPARLFPIYFPFGNMATGFFVIFSLIAGVVGMASSATGITNVTKWNSSNIHTASVSSLATFAVTILAMGFAWKEIELGWTDSNLRTLEVITIITSATQLLCTGAVQIGVEEMIVAEKRVQGRV
uniref:AWPM-19-like family protein n=1 Tax=Cucumis melo TaxID=3656 RepID=A0A9I9CPJ9_CUCME